MRRLTQDEIEVLLDRVKTRAEALEEFRYLHSYESIASDLGIHPKTVTKWVRRYGGLAILRGEK